MKKIVLAYSGGLDTSYAIGYLKKQYSCEVVALLIDLGEEKDLELLKTRALQAGAINCYIINGQEEFANDYLTMAIKANTMYEGVYPLVSALSRPLIAKHLVDIAHKEQAFAVAHGCTAKGNDQVRFDFAIRTLDPNIQVIAPLREHPVNRQDAIKYLAERNIEIPVTNKKPYSIDMNIWGRSCECGILEDPWVAPPIDAYELTTAPEQAPNKEETIEIEFSQGIPKALNGKMMPLKEMIVTLNKIAGTHGIGRIDHVENRVVGIKSREIYEVPAAITLIEAHKALETLCLLKDVSHYKFAIDLKIAHLIYEGMWFSPLFESLSAFINNTQTYVDGHVRLTLYKAKATVTGRKSTYSLYNRKLATYEKEDTFDHSAALGFIKLAGLPLEVYSRTHKQ